MGETSRSEDNHPQVVSTRPSKLVRLEDSERDQSVPHCLGTDFEALAQCGNEVVDADARVARNEVLPLCGDEWAGHEEGGGVLVRLDFAWVFAEAGVAVAEELSCGWVDEQPVFALAHAHVEFGVANLVRDGEALSDAGVVAVDAYGDSVVVLSSTVPEMSPAKRWYTIG